MSKILGIDLGTANSCMAVWEKGEVFIIPNAEGGRVTPSVVAFTADNEVIVGEPAKRQAVVNPKRTVSSIKRLIGKSYSELTETVKHLSYDVVNGRNGEISIFINEKHFTPQEITAFILKKLKKDAELYFNESVEKTIITVPAYFDDIQRQATFEAGKLAGLDVIGVINEPTSAAIAYGFDKNSNDIIMVYDLGGGTFDITVLEVKNNQFEVLATRGDTQLGGIDFDQRIISFLNESFRNKNGVDLLKDPQALQRLTDAAEKAKCELSASQSTEINLPFISVNELGPLHLSEKITRKHLEDLSADFVARTKELYTGLIVDAKLEFQDVDKLILTGGMTRMPKIVRTVKSSFHEKVFYNINPDEAVATGAALYAASLAGHIDDMILLDVVPISLGIETSGGIFTKLIEKNTSIPTRISEIFTTESDNQTSVTINVLQGESNSVDNNKSIGHFILTDINPAPKGTPHIDVSFDVDSSGVLNVSAVDMKTGRKKNIILSTGSLNV